MTAMTTCRELTAADFDEVAQLWRESEGLGNCETREQFIRFLDRNPGLSPAACSDGHIVAAVLCGHDGRRGYLYHLAVKATHRRQGITSKMLSWCVTRLAALRISRCTVHVYREHADGVNYWRHIGWRERVDLVPFAFDLQIENA